MFQVQGTVHRGVITASCTWVNWEGKVQMALTTYLLPTSSGEGMASVKLLFVRPDLKSVYPE